MNFLIVDDHPLIVDSYVALLSTIESNEKTNFHLAYNCEQAYNTIVKLKASKTQLDVAFIDVSLPKYEEMDLRSGDDIGILVQHHFPNCSIIIISMHNEPVWVNRIIKILNPQGFISKNDINYKSFPLIMEAITKKDTYYSKTIIDAQKEFIIKNINWDKHDSKILQLIAAGIKTKDLPRYITLSLSTIEKRKANLKKQLIFQGGSDADLIERIKKMGLLSNNR
ncbi:MAG: response regulator transcription factor [Bacteroidia bacterium]|nr:response regulator transcription factor [Bacteroidia bacterium]